MPSPVEGVPDVYLTVPQPFNSVDGTPGKGGTVSVFILSYNPPPPGRDQNPYWQELEKRLGVTWDAQLIPQPDYGEKASALLAGGDLPDLFYVNPGQNAPQEYQALAQGAFLDLTDRLTGDNLKQFPNLASFPKYAWHNMQFQGKIFGVPQIQPAMGNLAFYRTDWAQTLGINNPAGPDQIADMLKRFTTGDPDGNGQPDTWGVGRYGGGWSGWDTAIFGQMHRVPNNWRLNGDGTLTYLIETDEYRQFIQYMTDLYAAGAYYPDAADMSFSDAQNAFLGGKIGMHYAGFTGFFGTGGPLDQMKANNPDASATWLLPVGADGQPGMVNNGVGYFGYTAIPATVTNDDRVTELLSILNYLAAPFGSEERNFLDYGIEGQQSQRNANGFLELTADGRTQKSALTGIMTPVPTLFFPNDPQSAVPVQTGAVAARRLGIDDPTLVLYSETNVEKAPQLYQYGADNISAIVTGRQPVSSLDDVVTQWKQRGGDQIRSEFQDDLKNSS